MKKKTLWMMGMLLLLTLGIAGCNNDDKKDIDSDPTEPVFQKSDLLQMVHSGDDMTITSLRPSALMNVRQKYNIKDSIQVPISGTTFSDVYFHWLHIKQTTGSTYIINVVEPEPDDTVRHIEMECFTAYPLPEDHIVTFDYQDL